MKIILDLDGTILDCSSRMYHLFHHLAPQVPIEQSKYWAEKRRPRSNEDLLRVAGAGEEEITQFKRQWLDLIETEDFLKLDTILPSTIDALEELSNCGNLILLTSRRSREATMSQLHDLGVARYFSELIITGSGLTKIAACQHVASLAGEDLVVGDTEADISVARTLGATAVAVHSGCRNAAFLTTLEPDYLYADVFDFARRHFSLSGPVPNRTGATRDRI